MVNLGLAIRNRLTSIIEDAKTPVTFILLKDDPTTLSAYNQPEKTKIQIDTFCILSPVRHDDSYTGQGIDETARFKLIVFDLEYGGVNYIDNEWFTYNNYQNVKILIGTRYYRITDKAGHPDMPSQCPYLVLEIARMMDVQP